MKNDITPETMVHHHH